LKTIADRKVKGFSQGERTKVALARALVHDPQHLLLDEPTNGLDVMATRHLREWLRELRSQGCCVLLSSHVMQEVEALVDDLVIIAAGRVTLRGTPAELAQRFPNLSLEEIFVEAVTRAERESA
jgi:sodium transport system ATP-binding protein